MSEKIKTRLKAAKNTARKKLKKIFVFFITGLISVLPGSAKINYVKITAFAESVYDGKFSQRANAMTYQILIALIPMLLALFSITSLFDENFRLQMLDFAELAVPDYVWPAVSDVISGVMLNQNKTLFYSALGTGLFFSTKMIYSVFGYLNDSRQKTKQHNFIIKILLSIVMSAAAYAAVISSVAVFIAVSYAINWSNSNFLHSQAAGIYGILLFKWFFLFGTVYIFISALFYFAYADKRFFKFFSTGSGLSTALFVVLIYALKVYFQYFNNYNLIYGSLGALFALLFCINWMCTALLFGFELNISIYRQNITDELASSVKKLFDKAQKFLQDLGKT
ncbi:MAG: YihY/virulence factor BrkB family protein [Elusimicrobiota bacterium]|jgi:membrane protein|nr:YihY/virulence factor BrkB family protein [Elusimicrobiota bacterium]